MAYGTLPGHRPGHMMAPAGAEPKVRRACARCGRAREARKTSVLCADCRYTTTREERMLWAA